MTMDIDKIVEIVSLIIKRKDEHLLNRRIRYNKVEYEIVLDGFGNYRIYDVDNSQYLISIYPVLEDMEDYIYIMNTSIQIYLSNSTNIRFKNSLYSRHIINTTDDEFSIEIAIPEDYIDIYNLYNRIKLLDINANITFLYNDVDVILEILKK